MSHLLCVLNPQRKQADCRSWLCHLTLRWELVHGCELAHAHVLGSPMPVLMGQHVPGKLLFLTTSGVRVTILQTQACVLKISDQAGWTSTSDWGTQGMSTPTLPHTLPWVPPSPHQFTWLSHGAFGPCALHQDTGHKTTEIRHRKQEMGVKF
jgi:hypothetical protein